MATPLRGQPSPAGLAGTHKAVGGVVRGERSTSRLGIRWEIYGHWLEDQDPARFETEIYWLLAPA